MPKAEREGSVSAQKYAEAASKKISAYSAALTDLVTSGSRRRQETMSLARFAASQRPNSIPRHVDGLAASTPQVVPSEPPVARQIDNVVPPRIPAAEVDGSFTLPPNPSQQGSTPGLTTAPKNPGIPFRKQAPLPMRSLRPSGGASLVPGIQPPASLPPNMSPRRPAETRVLDEMILSFDPQLISSIVHYEGSPAELWKLDRRETACRRNANLTASINIPSTSATTPPLISDLQRFPTFHSLFIPLTVYFRILHSFFAVEISRYHNPVAKLLVATYSTQAYLERLTEFDEIYDWAAVLAYHMAFHERRRVEMAVKRGEGKPEDGFNGWAPIDGELMALYLFGCEKNRPKMKDGPTKKKMPTPQTVAPETETVPPEPRLIVTPPISALLVNTGISPAATSISSAPLSAESGGSKDGKTEGEKVKPKGKGKKKSKK